MLQRTYGWFLGLNLIQKVLALLFAALFLFSLAYLLTTVVLYLSYGGKANSPIEKGAAPNSASPGSSFSASAGVTVPNNKVSITSARWEGEKAEVKGSWKGGVSSVHCDLLEGGSSGKSVRWWDRSVGTQMDWSGRTFTQEFVAAKGSEDGESLDPKVSYNVLCSAQFSGGWSMIDSTRVEGTPPAEG